MRKQLLGRIKINAEGRELYHFINEIHSRKIGISGQYVKAGVLYGEVERASLKQIRSLADELDIKLAEFELPTLSKKLLSRRYRIGLFLGILIVLSAFLYLSNVIVTIEIQGSETVSKSEILSALEELGIEEGTPFGQINYVLSENKLRLMVDGISWVGMHRTGNRLVVEVTEIVPKPEMLNERLPCNVVASRDAEIVYTSVLDGQLMHIVGDYVFAGDMLINGVTSDATGHVTLHHAMGEIQGIYKETVNFEGQFTRVRKVPTGETGSQRILKLFGIKIPLSLGKPDFEYYTSNEENEPLMILGKQLPISLQTTEYQENSRIETTLSEEELRGELEEKIYLYEKNFLSDCEILERKITEKKDADTLTLTVEYKVKGDICTQKEILVK
ncbi:MAG: sporulation protein YqfD [Ruminococcus sp.]|nr:sporulation protein YqfD [Ruminococcus sp.]